MTGSRREVQILAFRVGASSQGRECPAEAGASSVSAVFRHVPQTSTRQLNVRSTSVQNGFIKKVTRFSPAVDCSTLRTTDEARLCEELERQCCSSLEALR